MSGSTSKHTAREIRRAYGHTALEKIQEHEQGLLFHTATLNAIEQWRLKHEKDQADLALSIITQANAYTRERISAREAMFKTCGLWKRIKFLLTGQWPCL